MEAGVPVTATHAREGARDHDADGHRHPDRPLSRLLKPRRKRYEALDTIVPGFAIRVTPSGHIVI